MSDHPRDEIAPTREDMRMVARAIKEDWDIDPELKAKVIRYASEGMDRASETEKDRIMQGYQRVILAAEAQNIAKQQHREKMQAAREGVNVEGGLTIVFKQVEPKELPDEL